MKDVLVHIAFWERYMVDVIKAAKSGETPQLDVEDLTESRNASVVAQYYLASLGAVLSGWHAAREELLDQIEGLSAGRSQRPAALPLKRGRAA